jgi:isocitrate dehydrogenase (NAD+)
MPPAIRDEVPAKPRNTVAHPVTLIPGDWIGPQVCAVAQRVVAALSVDVDWRTFDVPADAIPDALLASARATGTVLKAKVGARRQTGRLPATVRLRQELGTWATVRPVRALPGAPARFPDIDLVVIRETSEDIYSGMEHEITDGVYEAVKVTTRAASERFARFVFDYARENGRKKVTIVHKSNIMKMSDGLFLATAQAVAAEYPDIECDEVIVDALCMRLVRWPNQFDVLLCGNLFGDIVSDLASGLAGGIIASASFSVGDGAAIFETPHGKAPELVDQDRANPLPMLWAAHHMLAHLGEHAAAGRLAAAIEATIADGIGTEDMCGGSSTTEVEAAILARI